MLGGDKIGSAWVEIKVDDRKFRKGMSDAHGSLAAFSAVAPKMLKSIDTAFGGVTTAAADAAAAVSTVAVRGIKDYAQSPLYAGMADVSRGKALKLFQSLSTMLRRNSASDGSPPGAVEGVPASAAEKAAGISSVRFNEDIIGTPSGRHDSTGGVRQQEFMEAWTASQAFGKGLSEIFAQAFFQKACPWLWENTASASTSYQYSVPQLQGHLQRSTGRIPASVDGCFRVSGDFPHETFQSMDAYLSRIAESAQRMAERCPCLKQPVVIQPNIMISRDSDMRWLANELKPYL